MNSEQLQQLEKAKSAILIIDKVLPHLPDFGVFNFALYAQDVLHWTDIEIREIITVQFHIIHLALNQFQYINEKTKGYYYELNDKGREAKLRGGHFLYIQFIEEQKKIENERKERKDESDKLDLQIKQWQVRTKFLPYIVSILALTVSIFSYLKPYKKIGDLQQIQTGQKTQDSFTQVDTLIKKKLYRKSEHRGDL